jgi:hypothetical protein
MGIWLKDGGMVGWGFGLVDACGEMSTGKVGSELLGEIEGMEGREGLGLALYVHM